MTKVIMSPWITFLIQNRKWWLSDLLTAVNLIYIYVTVDWLEYSPFHLLETCDMCDKRRRKTRGTRGWFSCYMQGINLSSLHIFATSWWTKLWEESMTSLAKICREAAWWCGHCHQGRCEGGKVLTDNPVIPWDFVPCNPNLLQKTSMDHCRPWLTWLTLGLVECRHVSKMPS